MDDDTTRSDDLAAAWPDDDDLTLEGAAPQETETLQEVYNDPADQPAELDGDTGEGPAAGDNAVLDPGGSEGVPSGEGQDLEAPEDTGPESSSPVSWTASAREEWKNIPKAAQDYIAQREQEMQTGMQKNAELARRAEGMDRTLQPYQQYFAMNGGAGQTMQQLLQTGAGLQMGTPAQKAQIVNNIIQQYGVDIGALDSMITGADIPPEVQQQSAIQAQINQAIAPFQQREQQMQQQQQQFEQGQRNEAGNEVTTFAQDVKNEFYNDVRGDMADILDMAANRGIQMPLAEAYNRACQLNPEISRIVASRAAQRQLSTKRKAAVSIRGTLGGPGGNSGEGTMRSAIEDAWDNQGQM